LSNIDNPLRVARPLFKAVPCKQPKAKQTDTACRGRERHKQVNIKQKPSLYCPTIIMRIPYSYLALLITICKVLASPVAIEDILPKQKDTIAAFGRHIGNDNPTQLSFVDLLHRHPTGRRCRNEQVFAGFDASFAKVPEISSLDKLDPSAYVSRVMELRKVVENDPIARVNLRRAILHHMEQSNLDSKIIESVKDQYDTLNVRQPSRGLMARLRQKDPDGVKARYRARYKGIYDEKKEQQEKGNEPSKDMTFEEQLILHDIPKDADAFIIEEQSRNFHFSNKIKAFKSLEDYLYTRFDPSVVKEAVSKRRMLKKRKSHIEAFRNSRKRKQSEGEPMSLDHQDVNRRRKQRTSEAKNIRVQALMSNSAAISSSTVKDHSSPARDVTAHPFDNTNWWDKVF
jgi:hypothetical protein